MWVSAPITKHSNKVHIHVVVCVFVVNNCKHLSEHISMKWGKSYGEVMGWLRARLSFTNISATDLCLWGSRIRWRSALDMADGIGLPYIVE